MSVEIVNIPLRKSALRKFVQFPIDLYKDNPCYVPPLIADDIATLLPDKNPAFDYCRAAAFMAYNADGRPVGRIAVLINDVVNERTGRREARFGFVDFIDDAEVVDALFDAAIGWAREQGMNELVGPMGFSDMDHEGALTFGYDEMGTMATIYNHPYYITHYERLGFVKDATWVEYRITVPKEIPEKFKRIADIVTRKYGLRSVKFTSRRKLKEAYGQALFDLINEAYDHLYGYCPLSQRQIDYYIDQYLGIIRLDCISVIVDSDDKLVALGISMPSMSKALRKSRGRLFPTGWYHLLQGIHGANDVVDLLLIAVKKEYQSRGVNALLFADLIPIFNKEGYKEAESNIELEDNEAVRLQWQYYDHRLHRRRSTFRRSI
ncbi:MAG: N-acetyltransferase [Paramuribaculum sp.]|nr:N-acetyltransferase [Paramuribaculum sp.]